MDPRLSLAVHALVAPAYHASVTLVLQHFLGIVMAKVQVDIGIEFYRTKRILI